MLLQLISSKAKSPLRLCSLFVLLWLLHALFECTKVDCFVITGSVPLSSYVNEVKKASDMLL